MICYICGKEIVGKGVSVIRKGKAHRRCFDKLKQEEAP
jgi:hypothetical protein